MVRDRERPAGEPVLRNVFGRDDRVLGRLAQRDAVAVFVDDRFADHEYVHVGDDMQRRHHLLRGMPVPERTQVLLNPRPEIAEILVDQAARAEGLLVREHHTAADRTDGPFLLDDHAGQVLRRVGVFTAFGVHVRLELLDRIHRRGPEVERDVIDELERGERLHAQTLGEDGPARPLLDVLIWRDGDDEHVPVRPRRFEVEEMARMHQIEHAMAEDDAPALRARGGHMLAEFRE